MDVGEGSFAHVHRCCHPPLRSGTAEVDIAVSSPDLREVDDPQPRPQVRVHIAGVPCCEVASNDNVGCGRGGVAAIDGSSQVAEPRGGGAREQAVKEDVGGVGDGGR